MAVVCCWCSERHLAIDIWGEQLGMELYGEVVRSRLQALVATGRELIEARRTADKVRNPTE